jgi:hypothetical protein
MRVTIERRWTPVCSSPEGLTMFSLPIAFRSAIVVFAPVFSRPVWPPVKVLLTGAVLAPGQRTVPTILRIMGRRAALDLQAYHRVLNRASWSPLTASRLLLRRNEAAIIGVCALTPSLFGVSGRAMPRWGRRFNRHSRDHHRRLSHRHVGWCDRTSGDEQEPSYEHRDLDEHRIPFADLSLSFYAVFDCGSLRRASLAITLHR